MSGTPIVLSVDTGVDDALALAYLLAMPDARLLGVSATYGNVPADLALRNTRAVLSLFGRSDVPSAIGARTPSWARLFLADAGCARFHGANGLADLDAADYGAEVPTARTAYREAGVPDAVVADDGHGTRLVDGREWAGLDAGAVSVGGYVADDPHALLPDGAPVPHGTQRVHAGRAQHGAGRPVSEGARLIVDAVRAYGRRAAIVSLGPLTDVDDALRAAPDIAGDMRVVMMGGALATEGNCYDLVCETNVIQDPEAADRVLRSGADVTMVGLDVTHRCLMGTARTTPWRNARTAPGRFLADLASFSIRANADSDAIFADGMPLHDPLAAAVALDATLVDTIDLPLKVETRTGDGFGVRGRTVGDPARMNAPDAVRTHVALGVDAPRFLTRFTRALAALAAAPHPSA